MHQKINTFLFLHWSMYFTYEKKKKKEVKSLSSIWQQRGLANHYHLQDLKQKWKFWELLHFFNFQLRSPALNSFTSKTLKNSISACFRVNLKKGKREWRITYLLLFHIKIFTITLYTNKLNISFNNNRFISFFPICIYRNWA